MDFSIEALECGSGNHGQQEVGVGVWSSEQRSDNHTHSSESWHQNTLVREDITQGRSRERRQSRI